MSALIHEEARTFGLDVSALNYARALRRRLDAEGHLRKSEKSHLSLLAAGAERLNEVLPRDLSVNDIARTASLAKGTFYIYFPTKDAYLYELCQDYVDFESATVPEFDPDMPRFSQVLAFVAWYEHGFAENVGILRTLVQMSEQDKAFAALWQTRNGLITRQAERGILSWVEEAGTDIKLLRMAVRSSGALMDQSLFARHNIQADPGVNTELSADELVELHAVLIYRTMFAQNPPVDELRFTRSLIDQTRLRPPA